MCEMMSKGLKEALTVLIDTHVTHVERVKRLSYVETRDKHIFAHTFLNIQLILDAQNVFCYVYICQSMSKGLKVKITFDPFNMHIVLERSKSQLLKTFCGSKIS